MTIGIGGNSAKQALDNLVNMTNGVEPIALAEFQQRIENAQHLMRQQGVDYLFLTPGSNLVYFTNIQWRVTERLFGALIPSRGGITYVVPKFEFDSFAENKLISGDVLTWQEHEDPFALVTYYCHKNINDSNINDSVVRNLTMALCGASPFTFATRLSNGSEHFQITCADKITEPLRQIKSSAELAIIETVMQMTLAVQQAAASILYEGISCQEVISFIDAAHKKAGASGSYFCLVLFDVYSALPHGTSQLQTLKANDMVLIDTGCKLMGYTSDITRSYVFGSPSSKQRTVWEAEKQAQTAVFNAVERNKTCANLDNIARKTLAQCGFSDSYALPGLPHRTGHGIGLDIHESPYLVANDDTTLVPGMCFSNEPTICIENEFGVRLEDHFYVTDQGPKWFTEPSLSIDNPFGLSVDD